MTRFLDTHEGTITAVVTIVGAIIIIVTFLIKVWPFLTRLVEMVNGFVGYGGEPGVLDRVKALEYNSEHERGNHDKMSTQLDRVETRVHILSDRLDRFTEESNQDRKDLWSFANHNHGHDKG